MIKANDPSLKSWIEVDANSDFPIQNLPFGIFKTKQGAARVGSRIGDKVIDLNVLYVLGYFKNLPFAQADFQTDALNPLMKKGKSATTELRRSEEHTSELQSRPHLVCRLLLEKKKKNKQTTKTNRRISSI